jgi:hypothetical protein
MSELAIVFASLSILLSATNLCLNVWQIRRMKQPSDDSSR